jgi:hypothetical protein
MCFKDNELLTFKFKNKMKKRLIDLRCLYSLQRNQVNAISVALDQIYDSAIVGINAETGSLIYDSFELIDLILENQTIDEEFCLKFNNLEYEFETFITLLDSLFKDEQVGNKVPPTHLVSFPEFDITELLMDNQLPEKFDGDNVDHAEEL